MTTRIILVDDHRIVRDGLRALLEGEKDFQVVGEADSGLQAIDRSRHLQPNVIVMDVGMPELNGIEATRQITAMLPGVKVIALSMHSDERFVRRMFQAGASGYLKKDCAYPELTQAIRTVLKDRVYLSPEISKVVVRDYTRRTDAQEMASGYVQLTPRQREVLQMMAEGHPTKEIAATLHLSTKTIEAHRQNIMEKLKLRNVAELTKFAIREGLTSLDT